MSTEADPQEASRHKGLWKRYRFTVLLLVLIFDILVGPAIVTIEAPRHPNLGRALLLVIFSVLVVLAILATNPKRWKRRLAFALGAPTVIAAWLRMFSDREMMLGVVSGLELVFLSFVIVLLLGHVFRQRVITADIISASLCAYLLIGLTWASVYTLIEIGQPGSFHIPEDGFAGFAARGVDASVRRVYFSFVTLLTLGYGDVLPVGSIARLSAVIEAFAGQVYLAVLIARLVGIHVGQSMLAGMRSEENP